MPYFLMFQKNMIVTSCLTLIKFMLENRNPAILSFSDFKNILFCLLINCSNNLKFNRIWQLSTLIINNTKSESTVLQT